MSEISVLNDSTLTGYPSIDKPWVKFYSKEMCDRTIPECTIYKCIYENNKNNLDSVAILYYENRITYSKLFDEVEVCAKSLMEIGVNRGDCVTLCTAGIPEAIYIVLACSRIGAIANFINPMFSAEQMIDRINDTDARWIFVLDEMYQFIEGALPKTCIENVVIIPVTNSMRPLISTIGYYKSKAREVLSKNIGARQKYLSWKSFSKLGKPYAGVIDREYKKDTPVIMVYSSGTTGASKGILLTNNAVLATNYNKIIPSQHKRGDTFLQMIPVWFSTGIVISVLVPLLCGFTVIPELKFSKESFCRDLKKYKPVMTLTATSLWMYVSRSKDMLNADLSSMKCPITGGEKTLAKDESCINAFLKEHGCTTNIFKGYGMCELGGTVTSTSVEPNYVNKSMGVGYPLHNVLVSAFDVDNNKELMYGKKGELRVCTPAAMFGYYKNPQATAEFFWEDQNGLIWGKTGDIGYVDEDGEVFVLGRASDSATLESGKRIFLFDIEEIVLKNDDVSQCKVVDITKSGKVELVAHVVLRNGGMDKSIISQINDDLRNSLPIDEVPTYYKIREAMPVHKNGKRDIEALKRDLDDLIEV